VTKIDFFAYFASIVYTIENNENQIIL